MSDIGSRGYAHPDVLVSTDLMSRIGVTPATTVVFYGDKNNWWATYALWVFQLFGHANAKVLAAILDRTLSGLPADETARVDPEIVEKIFRQNISMGKGMGLMSMVQCVQALARRAATEKIA